MCRQHGALFCGVYSVLPRVCTAGYDKAKIKKPVLHARPWQKNIRYNEASDTIFVFPTSTRCCYSCARAVRPRGARYAWCARQIISSSGITCLLTLKINALLQPKIFHHLNRRKVYFSGHGRAFQYAFRYMRCLVDRAGREKWEIGQSRARARAPRA